MQKTVVFIDVPPDCVQHKLLIYFFRRTIVEPAEVFVLLDISKVAFSLNGSDLSVQDSFFYSGYSDWILPSVLPTVH